MTRPLSHRWDDGNDLAAERIAQLGAENRRLRIRRNELEELVVQLEGRLELAYKALDLKRDPP